MSSIRRILSGISTAATWASRAGSHRAHPTPAYGPRGAGSPGLLGSQRLPVRPGCRALPARGARPQPGGPVLASRRTRWAPTRGTATSSPGCRATSTCWGRTCRRLRPATGRRGALARGLRPRSRRSRRGRRQTSAGSPSVSATADLEKSFELAGEDDSVLLYTPQEGEGGRSVIQHADGSVTDPENPEQRFPDAQAWEQRAPRAEARRDAVAR